MKRQYFEANELGNLQPWAGIPKRKTQLLGLTEFRQVHNVIQSVNVNEYAAFVSFGQFEQ